MSRYKRNRTYKQAFIMTALVTLLCLVCLTGATLALFTSDESDGTIGIVTTAGEVKIDIVDLDGKTLQNRALAFMVSSKYMDSDSVYFEPGASFFTQGFKIKNDGNIPVKFHLSIGQNNIVDMKGNKVDINDFLEVFDMWITTDPYNPDLAEPMNEFSGRLGTSETDNLSETYYLIIKMKESVDNDFQGEEYSGIGVTVYAVQGNAEN